MKETYSSIVMQSVPWWIGWIEEIPRSKRNNVPIILNKHVSISGQFNYPIPKIFILLIICTNQRINKATIRANFFLTTR